jgi:hypothetical protein
LRPALLAMLAVPLPAQDFVIAPRVQPELRAEAVVARRASALLLVGANVPIGFYVRAGVAAGVGVVASDGAGQLAQRADLSLRFLLDPFGETPWGPYAGGGFTVRRDGGDRAAVGMLFLLGVEGRRGKRWSPSVEVAFGEGARLAVVLRRSRTSGR